MSPHEACKEADVTLTLNKKLRAMALHGYRRAVHCFSQYVFAVLGDEGRASTEAKKKSDFELEKSKTKSKNETKKKNYTLDPEGRTS